MGKIKIGIVIQGSLESQGLDCVQNCNELAIFFFRYRLC